MFMAIEGGVAEERKANAVKTRNDTANKLWDETCNKINVFNKSGFIEA